MMTATCLHCHARLPSNEVVEAFPFARQVAYDPAKQRYWVVCRKCGKWSLAPLEDDERAATIDHLERWWRESKTHYTSGGIGVGRYASQFEVVRIGEATWPEFALWRYADTIRRRRYRANLAWGASMVSLAAFTVTGLMPALSAIAVAVGLPMTERVVPPTWLRDRSPVCRIPSALGSRALLRKKHLAEMELQAMDGSWSVNTVHDGGATRLHGNEAIRALGYALERINYRGANKRDIVRALQLIHDSGGTDAVIERAADTARSRSLDDFTLVRSQPQHARIALELAARERAERRALENELAILKHEWREAEEIAGLASQLLDGDRRDRDPAVQPAAGYRGLPR